MRDFIDPNHLLIQTDEQLDFSKLVAPLEERYCPDFGRPAIHPEVMVPAFLVCSLYNIASFRKLCSAISENIAFRWFCFLTIDDWEGQRQRKEVRPAGGRVEREPSEQGVHGLAGPDTIGIAADFPAAQVPQPVCRQVGTRQSAGRIEGPTAGCMLMGS